MRQFNVSSRPVANDFIGIWLAFDVTGLAAVKTVQGGFLHHPQAEPWTWECDMMSKVCQELPNFVFIF